MGNKCSCYQNEKPAEIEIPYKEIKIYEQATIPTEECKELITEIVSNDDPVRDIKILVQCISRRWLIKQAFIQDEKSYNLSLKLETVARSFLAKQYTNSSNFSLKLKTVSRSFIARQEVSSLFETKQFEIFKNISEETQYFIMDFISELHPDLPRFKSTLNKCDLVKISKNLIYQGELSLDNKMPNGFGIQINPDKSVYIGYFENGNYSGKGQIIFDKTKIMKGTFKSNCLEGKVKIVFPDSFTYRGDFRNDLFHGAGKIIYNNKDSYEGQWRKGMIHGEGTFQWKNGQIYNGYFVKGLRNGVGIMKYPDGRIYNGEWINDMRHGYASYKFFDKSKQKFRTYNSYWENDEMVTFLKKNGEYFNSLDI